MVRFLFLLFFLVPQILFGADLYVDYSSGDDANAGTSSGSPKKTIQDMVDNATQGDTIYLSDSAAHVLAAAITWTTGFTASGTTYTTFKAWDNGGSITIQRPDEATARVAAEIDGNSTATHFLNYTSHPNYIALKDLKIHSMTSSLVRFPAYGVMEGCEFDCTGNTTTCVRHDNSTEGTVAGSYIHSYTSTGYALSIQGSVYNTYFDVASTSANGSINLAARGEAFYNNIVKVTGGNVGFYAAQRESKIYNNTFISDGTASAVGLEMVSAYDGYVYNNLFYNFDGTSAKPLLISGTQKFRIFGNNAYFDSNTADSPTGSIGSDLTGDDIVTTGDPFVSSGTDDYCVTGSSAEDAAYPTGSLLDIGALECTASGGGGGAATISCPFVQ